MKFLQLSLIIFVIGCSLLEIHSKPIKDQEHQVDVILPEYVKANLPASTKNPDELVVAPVPFTLLENEDANKPSINNKKEYQRSARGLGGFGGLGGLSSKFGGLGLGFKGFGNLGGWGFGGLHGLGLGGFKPFLGKHFG